MAEQFGGFGRVAHFPVFGGGLIDAAGLEIGSCRFRVAAFHEELVIPLRDVVVELHEAIANLGGALRIGVEFFFDLDVGGIRETLHGIHELETIVLHEEANHGAARAAAEAVVGAALGVHIEGGRLLRMEWTETFPSTAHFPEPHMTPDQVHDIRGGDDLLKRFFRYAGHEMKTEG